MSTPESTPVASASADIFMDIDSHRFVRGEVLNLARELDVLAMPTSYKVTLGGIALKGAMPLTYRGLLGDNHHRMSFEAEKLANHEPGDARMSITLHGPSPERQVHITADKAPVEFGQHKMFNVVPHGTSKAIGRLGCDDACILLDDYIPNPGRTFSALADPRRDIQFDAITHAIGDSLAQKSKTTVLRHLYSATDSRISNIFDDYTELYSGASLSISQENKDTTYTLRIAAPIDLHSSRVVQAFSYKFNYSPWKGKSVDTRAVDADARISLVSQQLSRSELERALGAAQNHDGFDMANRAMEMLRRENLQ